MLIVARVGAETVKAIEPATEVFAVDVAVMAATPATFAVTTPVLLTEATAVLLDVQVTVRATPGSASTLATSCRVAFSAIVALGGDTVTLRTCGTCAAETVIVTLAFLLALQGVIQKLIVQYGDADALREFQLSTARAFKADSAAKVDTLTVKPDTLKARPDTIKPNPALPII